MLRDFKKYQLPLMSKNSMYRDIVNDMEKCLIKKDEKYDTEGAYDRSEYSNDKNYA